MQWQNWYRDVNLRQSVWQIFMIHQVNIVTTNYAALVLLPAWFYAILNEGRMPSGPLQLCEAVAFFYLSDQYHGSCCWLRAAKRGRSFLRTVRKTMNPTTQSLQTNIEQIEPKIDFLFFFFWLVGVLKGAWLDRCHRWQIQRIWPRGIKLNCL